MFKKWKRSLFGILLIQLFVKTFGGNLKINVKNVTYSDMERSAAVNRMLLNSHIINKENTTTIIATHDDYDKKAISLSKESVQEKGKYKGLYRSDMIEGLRYYDLSGISKQINLRRKRNRESFIKSDTH